MGGGFLQRVVAGVDKGICYSAVNGQLLGAVLCTKTISDSLRKLVSGELQALSPEVYARLERFVRDTHWTGGMYVCMYVAVCMCYMVYICNVSKQAYECMYVCKNMECM